MSDEQKSFQITDSQNPTVDIGHADDTRPPQAGIALCLSGGGYRAMLFHLGALVRLNQAGFLNHIDRISSVSGGSIAGGMLGLAWSKLAFDGNGVATNFTDLVTKPLRVLAAHTIDIGSVFSGVFGPGTVADRIANQYRKYLFQKATLQDLPDKPRFVINATNVQSKSLWRFSNPYMWDWRVGKVVNPKIELAIAVGASSAFPPVLSPVELDMEETDYRPNTGTGLQRPPYTTQVILTDGGVYDNLGLETAWKRYATVLVSDGGGMYGPEPDPDRDWFNHTRRVYDLIDNQVRSLRKRLVIESYVAGTRQGTYWGIWSDISNYSAPHMLACPYEKTSQLAATPTRLKGLDDTLQEQLMNWGYAICDAAMRKHYAPNWPPPTGFPFAGGVG